MTTFKKYSFKSAFTLAEVLVTLGIIGVVSAMTVPTLIQNHQRKTYVVQLHKFYNEMSQALLQYQTDKNAVNLKEAGLNSNAAIGDFIKKYFKVVNDCGSIRTPCFGADTYKKINGGIFTTSLGNYLTIASGVSIAYAYVGNENGNGRFITFDIDINGAKGPNVAGRDAFVLGVFSNGVIDEYYLKSAPGTTDEREKIFNENCIAADNNSWYGCFGKILNDNWEMTY